MYMKFLKKGLVYGRERVRVFCAAFYVVYITPPDTHLLSSGKGVRFVRMKQKTKNLNGGKEFTLAGLRGAFALP